MSMRNPTAPGTKGRKLATPPRRRALILDAIHPRDYRGLNIIHYCEQCSHFALGTKSCTIGYEADKHIKEAQDRNYELTGKVAFCRFCEID